MNKPTVTQELTFEQAHERFNDLMKAAYPYITTDQRFALALCAVQAEPDIYLRIEMVEKICNDWSVPV